MNSDNSDPRKTIRGRGRGRGKGRRGSRTVGQSTSAGTSQGSVCGRGRPKRRQKDEDVNIDFKKRHQDSESQSVLASTVEETKTVCPVCLDPPVHETQLSCGHSYCFLCAKGLAESGKATCSLCRQPIPSGFFKTPQLIKRSSVGMSASVSTSASSMCWYYEGRNGWWRFEERHSEDIEAAFQAGHPHTELLICGQIYLINLLAMTQFRKDFPTRIRQIKRDLATAHSIGVAGLIPSD